MTPAKIQYELKRRGITQRAIADGIGRSEQHVGQVILGRSTSHRTMTAIAKAIEKRPEALWPDYYLRPKRPSARRPAKV